LTASTRYWPRSEPNLSAPSDGPARSGGGGASLREVVLTTEAKDQAPYRGIEARTTGLARAASTPSPQGLSVPPGERVRSTGKPPPPLAGRQPTAKKWRLNPSTATPETRLSARIRMRSTDNNLDELRSCQGGGTPSPLGASRRLRHGPPRGVHIDRIMRDLGWRVVNKVPASIRDCSVGSPSLRGRARLRPLERHQPPSVRRAS